MSFYAYHAVDSDGKPSRGGLEAATMEVAQNELASRGLYVITLEQTGDLSGTVSKFFSARKVSRSDVIEFAGNLAVMLKAGLPILSALSDIIVTTDNRVMRIALTDIRRNIEMGARFSDAAAARRDIFPDIFIRLVRVGEETGSFEESLANIADHLQKMQELVSTLKRALIYPIFAIVTTFGALIFWLVFVLPKIIGTLQGMGVKLPLLTRILIAASQFTQKYWMFLPVIPMAFMIINYFVKRNEKTRYYMDVLKLKLPILKLIMYNKLVALFCEQMRILVMSGLTIDKVLDLIADVIGNEVFRRAILKTKETVMYGSLISDAMREQNLFPMLMIRMVNIGETSGTLEGQFTFLSDHFRKKLDAISANIGKIIEPVVIGMVGLMFGLIIMGLMLPIYELVSHVGKS